jgi:hypothetical protein
MEILSSKLEYIVYLKGKYAPIALSKIRDSRIPTFAHIQNNQLIKSAPAIHVMFNIWRMLQVAVSNEKGENQQF